MTTTRRGTQVVLASTLYGAATVAAAIDDGALGPAERRVLVTSNNAAFPEVTAGLTETPGFATLAPRFDEIVSLNDVVAPMHPALWAPRNEDLPLLERLLRTAWDLGDDDVHLIVESIQVNPAQAVCRIFADARIDVYADGLMSYGPTRSKLPVQLGTRLDRLLFLDLVPDLVPLLLQEWDVAHRRVDLAAVRRVLDTLTADSAVPALDPDRPVALLLGQYLSALGIISPAAEADLHVRMVRGAAQAGHRDLVFKPHPVAVGAHVDSISQAAAELGVRLHLIDEPMLAEALFARWPIGLVVGCFSTALFTARRLYELPVARVGTGPMLHGLTPFQNSNRVPLSLVHALVADLEDPAGTVLGRGPDGTDGLVVGLGYAMQPELLADRRDHAREFLERNQAWALPYFKRKRLTLLQLPGSFPRREPAPVAPPRPPTRRPVRRHRRVARELRRRLRRRLRRATRALLGRDVAVSTGAPRPR